MADPLDTLVITVTRNNLATAQLTIPHLKSLTRRPFHYAVVANGDTDSGQWLMDNRKRGWFDSLAVVSENLGVSPAYNLFWRHFHRFSRELTYVVKFDDDNIPVRADWLDELVDLAAYFKGRIGMAAFLIAGNDREWPVQEIEGWRVRPTPTNCSGSCCLISRWVWEAVGLWDEEHTGWLGVNRDVGPVYYSREDGMMGELCILLGLQNMYHEDLDAIRKSRSPKDRKEDYVRWKNAQYAMAVPFRRAVWRDYSLHRRALPHRPPI
jgi:hypothetical protein